jgi:hypothetical protein
MTRDRIICPECQGRQLVLVQGVQRECRRCLGDGYVFMLREFVRPGWVGFGEALAAFLGIVALVIVASVQ